MRKLSGLLCAAVVLFCASGHAAIMYGAEPGDTLYTVDMATGATTFVADMETTGGTTWGFNSSLAFDPSGHLWGFSTTLDQFGVINTTTGVVTALPTVASGTTFLSGITFAGDGTMYACDEHGDLYTVDTTSGALTSLFTPSGSYTGISYAGPNTLYAVDYGYGYPAQSDVYVIDLATQTETSMGTLAFTNVRDMCRVGDQGAFTLAFTSTESSADNIGYATTYPLSSWKLSGDQSVTLDGIAVWPLGGDDPGPGPEIPELATLAALAAGAGALLARRRRR